MNIVPFTPMGFNFTIWYQRYTNCIIGNGLILQSLLIFLTVFGTENNN